MMKVWVGWNDDEIPRLLTSDADFFRDVGVDMLTLQFFARPNFNALQGDFVRDVGVDMLTNDSAMICMTWHGWFSRWPTQSWTWLERPFQFSIFNFSIFNFNLQGDGLNPGLGWRDGWQPLFDADWYADWRWLMLSDASWFCQSVPPELLRSFFICKVTDSILDLVGETAGSHGEPRMKMQNMEEVAYRSSYSPSWSSWRSSWSSSSLSGSSWRSSWSSSTLSGSSWRSSWSSWR